MAPFLSSLPLLGSAYLLHFATKAGAAAIDTRAALSPYAPIPVSCPSTPLVRSADAVGSSESAYVKQRKAKADVSLAKWLSDTNAAFPTSTLPTLALTLSGGGLRALLTGAGVLQAFDSRDSTAGTAGLFQSSTYQGALSGGAWLTSSLAGNNWPTISSLQSSLWERTFADSLLDPANLLVAVAYAEIVNDIVSKAKAGYEPTLIDVYGRLLGYQLLKGADGGVATTLSDVTGFSNFTSHNVPYPIITSRGLLQGQCTVVPEATQYEFTPYEFGSWDSGVHAFVETAYLGSSLSNGLPTAAGVCISNYDNLGYIAGTSSDVFNSLCDIIPPINSTTNLTTTLEAIVADVHDAVERDLYAVYPNPFYKYSTSSLVEAQEELHLVDGGEGLQNMPIWPFIQDARKIDVLIISDSSADSNSNYPNGTEIRTTYEQAQSQGLTRMPFIPDVDTFVSAGLNKRATFFGCDNDDVVTIIYLPNNDYSYASNTSTFMIQYTPTETRDMIANGNLVATQNGDADWPTCVGCAIMKKTGEALPSACTACFDTYCYAA
ncbi:hypothetical protein AAFC00_004042 [Neodothiora populina]|uniref:Lysophospholipase n=1 Tax=Neodothiora populina TaxID=2781224 RepID=A0ABR3PIC3_9PEZI